MKLHGRRRHRAADAGRRDRRGLRARGARRPHDRHRRQPEAGEADGHRVERHGAGRQPRRRQADAGRLRSGHRRRAPGSRVDGDRLVTAISPVQDVFAADLDDVVARAQQAAGVDRRPVHPRAGDAARSRCRDRAVSGGSGRRVPCVRAIGDPPASGRRRRWPARRCRRRARRAGAVRRAARRTGDRGDRPRLSLRLLARETSSGRFSRAGRHWRVETGSAGRSSTRAKPRTTRSTSCAALARAPSAASFTVLPAIPAMARRALDSASSFRLAGIVTFPRAEELRDVARMMPADRLLIETDAPYLAPVPHRGKAQRAGVRGPGCGGHRRACGRSPPAELRLDGVTEFRSAVLVQMSSVQTA